MAADELRPRRFRRSKLVRGVPRSTMDQLVQETEDFLERRYNKLAKYFDDISKTNFNPFLVLITSPIYNIFSPLEVAERLQLAKAFHGDDTAFGRMVEEKYLPVFGASVPAEKKENKKKLAWTPIDIQIEVEGRRFLISVKSGPWTMNQEHANAMVNKFPNIHQESNANILIGITYGRYEHLNNKPMVVENGLGSPEWFDYLVGRDFWEFVSGISNVHVEIFRAIRTAQKKFLDRHKDETFHEKILSNRIKIAASLRKKFDVETDKDFWETLFRNAF